MSANQQGMPHLPGGGIDLSHLAGAQRAPQAGGTSAAGGAAGPGGGPVAQDPQAAPGGPVPVPDLVLDATDATFESIAQLSAVVPVILHLWSPRSEASAALGRVIETVVREQDGALLLARVDADANPGLAQALQAQAVPTDVALVGGRPVPLFQGDMPEPQLRELIAQLLQLAQQSGVSGRVEAQAPSDDTDADAPAEPQTPPEHLAAVEAAERGDFDTAVAEWEAVLQRAPADKVAQAALVQMRLLQRLQGKGASEIREAAAAAPADVDAQLLVADLDVSGGHVEDAFLRVLDLFQNAEEDDRERIKARLLELFEVVGVSDARVAAARTRLANLLY